MPPKVQKSKKAKLLAAQSASKSKGKKKKWAKGKLREKKNHHVCFTQSLLDKILKDVPVKSKVITVYNLVESYKINCSLARKVIRMMIDNGSVKQVSQSAHMPICTKIVAATEE